MNAKHLIPSAVATALLTQLAWSHSGDNTYHHLDYGQREAVQHAAQTGTDPLVAEVRAIIDNLGVRANEAGETLLPAGSSASRVTFDESDGFIRAWIDLPADAGGKIDWYRCETAHEVIRINVQDDTRVRGTELFARLGAKRDWQPLDALFPLDLPPLDTSGDDWFEPNGPGPQPAPDYAALARERQNITGQGPIGTGDGPTGALSGRTVWVGAGHGWTWGTSSWYLQRPLLLSMNEDHGNIDQMQFTCRYLFNAGATVVPTRPVDHQPNEVVLDNTSPGVTFQGAWTNSTNPSYYGPGNPSYRFADAAPTETATATYTPNIPEAGFYPVYGWANFGSDRISGQLYRIRHTGGESTVRVNHRRVGRGWVWLGSYHFEAGSHPATGSVVISNAAPPSGTTTGIVIADAIRFGNGVGDINRGGGVSGHLRETEAARYWTQNMAGTALPSGTWDIGGLSDGSDNVGTPPRTAAAMRRDDGQGYNGDIYLGYHSNAANATARGCVGLITTSGGPTPTNQPAFASMVAQEQDDDSLIEDANWEQPWYNRPNTYTSGFGEISNSNLNGEMCGTIIETAFHDTPADVDLLRDPKARQVWARSHVQAIVQYFNQFDGGPLAYAPEPPRNPRAQDLGDGTVVFSWSTPPVGEPGGDAPTAYRIYTSSDGLGFALHSTVFSLVNVIAGLPSGEITYLRASAINAGGESFPSETLAVRPGGDGQRVLIVNGYDRIDRFNNIEEYPGNPTDDENERLRLVRNNSYDYVRQHAEALAAHGARIDSCANEKVAEELVNLGDYDLVVWICGEESTGDETFNTQEQRLVAEHIEAGGNLFVSGAELGWDLVAQGSFEDRTFFNEGLHSDFVWDDSNSYTVNGAAGTVFEGLSLTFNTGGLPYLVDYPDALAATGGARLFLHYASGNQGAGIHSAALRGRGHVFVLGFPFETIDGAASRADLMGRVLEAIKPIEIIGVGLM